MGDDQSALSSPERVIDAFQAFHRTAAVKAGVELDLFTAIGEGDDTAQALAARCQAAERGIRILCDYLVVIGLLRKEGSRYALAIDAATFLDRHSPAYFGSAVSYFACETNQEAFARLTAAVRQGRTVLPEDGGLAPEHPVWVEFAYTMAPIGAAGSFPSRPRPYGVRAAAGEGPCVARAWRAGCRAGARPQRGSRLAAGGSSHRLAHVGNNARGRRLHLRAPRPDVSQRRLRSHRTTRPAPIAGARRDRLPLSTPAASTSRLWSTCRCTS